MTFRNVSSLLLVLSAGADGDNGVQGGGGGDGGGGDDVGKSH